MAIVIRSRSEIQALSPGAVPKRSKYRNRRTCVDGIWFASGREAGRYSLLKNRERAGEIRNLELQPKFPCVVAGAHICDYLGDFRYFDMATRAIVVEDVKSPATKKNAAYRIKKKLVEALYGIDIKEV